MLKNVAPLSDAIAFPIIVFPVPCHQSVLARLGKKDGCHRRAEKEEPLERPEKTLENIRSQQRPDNNFLHTLFGELQSG